MIKSVYYSFTLSEGYIVLSFYAMRDTTLVSA
jgi:hypothetical protein